jgi:phage terminase large subunit-like protein
MRWDDALSGGHECYRWYDLAAGEGTENDALLGYVRENLVDHTFIAQINDRLQPTQKFNNLADAKAHIVAYYVTQKLEGT